MNMQYHKWLEIEVTNNYFSGGICPVLQLVPFIETSKQLINSNILSKKEGNVFLFYCGTEATDFNLSSELSGLEELYFQVLLEDHLFFNYTEIPFASHPNLFLFQNVEASSQLQFGEFVSEDDLIDASLTFSDAQFQTNCIGILKLNVAQIINDPSKNSQFRLQFKAREVFWQYQIIIPSNGNMEVTLIGILGIHQEVYNGPIEKQFVGGQVALVFTSPSPLALQQRLQTNPELALSYIDPRTNREDVLKVKLPNPGVEQIAKYITPEGIDAFCVTTIVYV